MFFSCCTVLSYEVKISSRQVTELWTKSIGDPVMPKA